MRRRDFVTLLGGAPAWPLAAHAQQAGKIYRIGFLANNPAIPTQPAGQAFLDGLRENGFIEGKSLIIDRRFSEGNISQHAEMVVDLLRLSPDVIVTSSNNATLAAKRATAKIPIVMMNVFDPVGQRLVASLAHPGGNITGVVFDESAEFSAKRLQFLRDAIPGIRHVAVLTNLDEPYARVEWNALGGAAQSLGMTLRAIEVHSADEYWKAFESMTHERPDALFIAAGNTLNFEHRRVVTQLAASNKLPTVSNFRETTEVGGLISYGSVRTDRFRQAAILVAKILKGTKPGDLPVEQPTKYELVINLKTARLLGLEIPRDLLLATDEVIE